MAFQQVDRFTFGTGRILKTMPGALGPLPIAIMNDVSVDLKSDNKSVWGEGSFPALVADGHKSIEVTAKNYVLQLQDLADDYGGGLSSAQPIASVNAYVFDEIGTVASHTYTLVNGASLVAGSAVIVGYVTPGGATQPQPVRYQIVASSPVAGVSCTISGVGLITFNSSDTVSSVSVSYEYANTSGQQILLSSTYQNSSPTYSIMLAKRDRSPIDGSVGILMLNLFQVRPGGIKMPFKEGDWSDFDRTWQAFADPMGRVAQMTFVNI